MSRTLVFFITASTVFIFLTLSTSAQRPPANQPPGADESRQHMQTCMSNLRTLHIAMHEYANKHERRLPPDLGSILPHVPPDAANKPLADPARVSLFLCPFDQKGKNIPPQPTAQWINENSSYDYLGGADLKLESIPREKLATTVIAHERLTAAKEKHRALLSLLFADGHVEIAPRAPAEKMIADSKQTLQSLRAR